MTPELKSFLTDLLAVLEKHDAEMTSYNDDNNITIDLGDVIAAEFFVISADEIKQALEQ